MTYQEKRSYVQFTGNLVGFIIYIIYVLNQINGVEVTIPMFGKYVVLLVLALVVAQIITKIIFDIFNRTEEKKEEPKFMDELDYTIELRSVRNFCFAFLAVFFLVMILMWVGVSLTVNLLVMLGGIFVAGTVLEVSYIISYRRGV